jgi:hypothetical protein
MSDSLKKDLSSSLQKAQSAGKLHSENLREIVRDAVSRAIAEVQEGSGEIRSISRTALATVTEVLQDKGTELKEEMTASIEGIVQGIGSQKRQQIARVRGEVEQLQKKLDTQEDAIRQEIDTVFNDLHDLKEREELRLLQQRYAQLKSQLAIVQANLAEQYGYGSEEVKKHLDEAKRWYENAKDNPDVFTEPVKQKYQDFEEKLGATGTTLAEKERKTKQQLRELWCSITELFDRGKIV